MVLTSGALYEMARNDVSVELYTLTKTNEPKHQTSASTPSDRYRDR